MNKHRVGLYFIVFLFVFGYIGLLLSGDGQKGIPKAPLSFPSQEECEKKTGIVCSLVMCDDIPEGKTFEEVCGKGFIEGWQPRLAVE